MQRYNPPTTSNQYYCDGCNRQIRKVNSMYREMYIADVNQQTEKAHMMTRIRELERKLEIERTQKGMMKTMLSKTDTPEAVDDRMKELMEINRRLTVELQKTKEVSPALPFDEWKQGFEEDWSEKYDTLEDYALRVKADLHAYKERDITQRSTIDRLKREVHRLKKSNMEKDEIIEQLENAAEAAASDEEDGSFYVEKVAEKPNKENERTNVTFYAVEETISAPGTSKSSHV